jgi:hypothetical protein
MHVYYNNWREMCADLAKERDELRRELADAKAEIAALKLRGAFLDEQMDAGILVDLGKHNCDRTGMGNRKEAD